MRLKILFFLFFPSLVFSQKINYDTAYIADYANYLTLRGFFINKTNNFKITKRGTMGEQSISYKPNNDLSFGIGFNYKWLGINASVANVLSKDQNTYGSTSQIDLQAQVYARKFIGEAHYIQYRGFYLDNPETTVPNWEKGKNASRSDIKTFTMGVSLYYVLNNKKFSTRSATLQNEIQKKRAGSLLLGAYHVFINFQSDSSMIPKGHEITFKDQLLMRRYVALHTGLGAGYAYNLVIKKHFFFNISFIWGAGVQQKLVYNAEGKKEEQLALSHKLNSRIALGYHSKRFFVLLASNMDNYVLTKTEDLKASYDTGTMRLVFGIRLENWKIWQKKSVKNS